MSRPSLVTGRSPSFPVLFETVPEPIGLAHSVACRFAFPRRQMVTQLTSTEKTITTLDNVVTTLDAPFATC